MAAVLAEKKNPAAKYATAVDEQIAQATSRIRVHDLAFGGLLLVALVLVYTTTMILLDRYLDLPEWVRQLGLLGLLAAAGGTAFWTIVRPLRRRVNPLYAAVQVEKTIEDAKNSVVGYVEAQEKGGVHPAVQAAMSARAAKTVVQADVNRAVDHRSLVFTGAVAVVLLLTLVVLFFVFRPAQFSSLVGRTFAPFSAGVIANRTQLTLTEPTGGDTTITAGQSVTVKVEVGGKIPSPDGPDRLRVLLRHSPAAPEYEEIAMEAGETSRVWQARVPDHLVRNGFWYKVAGGDAETPEYKVSVRSLPLFTEFEVGYEYPPYTRRKPEPATKDPHLEAYRGTKVTITGRTNRTVKDGRIVFDPPGRDPVVGKVPADRPDSIRFQFFLTEGGTYKVYFTSAEGERNLDPPPFGIRVIEDEAPKVDVVKPEEDEVTVPANGQLAVDARIGDDFGIDRAVLKLRLAGAAPRPLADRPYQDGKSFRRDRDGTWPTALDYKDSVDFAALKDAAGQKVELKEGMVLEYWLEATDNRTRPGPNGHEPDPNVGRSRVKKVLIAAPVMPDQQEKNDARKQERKAEEKSHNQAQQKRLDTEQRDPKPNPGQPQPPEGAQGTEKEPAKSTEKSDPGTAKPPEKPEPKMPPDANPEGKKGPDQQPPGAPMPKKEDQADPMMPPPGGMPMSEPGKNGAGQQDQTAPPPSEPGKNQARQDVEKTADQVQQELNKEAEGGGGAKSGPPQEGDRANPGEAKPPTPGDMPPNDPPKDGPKPGDPSNPMTGGKSAPETKPAGQPEKPETPSESKPDPGMAGQQGGTPQADNKNQKPGGTAGGDKETPKAQPNTPQESAGGGESKPATQQKTKPEAGTRPMPNPNGDTAPPDNPAGDAAKPKPMPKNDPGTDREPGGNPMAGTQPDTGAKPEGGATKPRTTPDATAPKPAPEKTNPMPGGGGAANESKPAPQDMGTGDPMNPGSGSAASKPEKNTNPMASGGGSPEKGSDKPRPDQQAGGRPDPGAKGTGGEQRKLDPKQEQEVKDALNNLGSKDPDKRKAAQDKLDQMVGEKNRKAIEKEAEDLAKDLKSDDPKRREAAQQKLNDLKKQAEQMAKNDAGQSKPDQPGAGQKPDPKQVEKAVQDLQSSDPKTRDAAKEKLDQTFGKGAGQKTEDFMKDLKSDDPKRREAAQQKLNDLKKQAEQMAKAGGTEPKKGPNETGGAGKKIDRQEAEKAVKDLESPDPKTREAAKEKLDDMFGKGAGQAAENLMKDLKSDDPKTREAAQKKLNDLKKQAEEFAKNNPGQPKPDQPGAGQKADPKQVEKAIEDLNSPDPKTRDAAKEKLDQTFGKGAGQKAEDINKRMNSDDPDKQAPARKERDDLIKKAEEMARKGQDPTPGMGKEPSPEELADLAKKAEDLNSKDEAKRQAAEKELDQKLGEENRKKLQEAMKNQADSDPKKAEEARKQLEEMAKKSAGAGGEKPDGNRVPKGPPGSPDVKLQQAMKEDARNRAKSAELQLEKFEKNKHNKDLLDRLKMSEREYENFLDAYRKEAARLKQVADDVEKAGPAPLTGPPTANVSEAHKVGGKEGATGSATGGGALYAAPGYAGALQKFQQGAAKVRGK